MTDIYQLKENGEAVYMKSHVQALDGIDGALVKASGNETVSGIKNFQDGLQSKGENVAVEKFAQKTVVSTNTSYFKNSSIIFMREGRSVTVQIVFTSAVDNLPGWEVLVAFPPGFSPATKTGWGGGLTNQSNRNPSVGVYANSNGIAVMPTTATMPKDQTFSGCVSYKTADSWPS